MNFISTDFGDKETRESTMENLCIFYSRVKVNNKEINLPVHELINSFEKLEKLLEAKDGFV